MDVETQVPNIIQKSKSFDENLEALKDQVETAIRNVNKDRIDELTVGQTKIQRNKAVIMSWGKQRVLPDSLIGNEELIEDEDGVVLYVDIKYKKNEIEEEVEEGDFNNNETTDINDDDFGMGESGSSFETAIDSPSFDNLGSEFEQKVGIEYNQYDMVVEESQRISSLLYS